MSTAPATPGKSTTKIRGWGPKRFRTIAQIISAHRMQLRAVVAVEVVARGSTWRATRKDAWAQTGTMLRSVQICLAADDENDLRYR